VKKYFSQQEKKISPQGILFSLQENNMHTIQTGFQNLSGLKKRRDETEL